MMNEVDDIIAELSACEKRILKIIGRINASPNKNFHRITVHKKAKNEELPYVDSILGDFLHKGLIRYYRPPDNFATTHLGFKVAQRLKEEDYNNKYPGMRIIRR